MREPSAQPTPKVAAAGGAGVLTVVVAAVLAIVGVVDSTGLVAAAITAALVTGAAYVKKDPRVVAIFKRISPVSKVVLADKKLDATDLQQLAEMMAQVAEQKRLAENANAVVVSDATAEVVAREADAAVAQVDGEAL